LRKQHVRGGERALHRKPRAYVVATLRPRGDAVEKDRASRDDVRDDACPAVDVGRRESGLPVRARVVVRVRAAADEDPPREAAERRGPADRDDRVQQDRESNDREQRPRSHALLEERRHPRVADREEERRGPEGKLRGHADDEAGVVPLVAALQHVRRRQPMDREDPRHAEESGRDEQASVVAGAERGARDEDRDEQRDDGDIRRDHEVLDRNEHRGIALRIGEQGGEDDRR